jgi:hypothetical protein
LGENLLLGKKNKKATNLTNGFFEDMAQSNHILGKFRP